jgi:hypothetical protein
MNMSYTYMINDELESILNMRYFSEKWKVVCNNPIIIDMSPIVCCFVVYFRPIHMEINRDTQNSNDMHTSVHR